MKRNVAAALRRLFGEENMDRGPEGRPSWEAESQGGPGPGRTICTIDSYHSGVGIWHYSKALEMMERPALIHHSWTTTNLRSLDVFAFDVVEAATIDEEKGEVEVCWGRRGELLVYAFMNNREHNVSVYISAPRLDFDSARKLMQEYRTAMPVLIENDPEKVQLNFWYQQGDNARSFPRSIIVPEWSTIATNYSADTLAGLQNMMQWKQPELSAGKLFLWHGPPGVGKTFAIRALAREWRSWCRFHFITDPEQMLNRGQYCMSVLEQGTDEDDLEAGITHHVLVMEDTGELLARDAKERTGQGLSRLLNIVDGILGQGHNVMVLITTNEDLGQMHAAVTRPGRCAMNLSFEQLTEAEAKAWMKAHDGPPEVVSGHMTVAELYAMLAGRGVPTRKRVGF